MPKNTTLICLPSTIENNTGSFMSMERRTELYNQRVLLKFLHMSMNPETMDHPQSVAIVCVRAFLCPSVHQCSLAIEFVLCNKGFGTDEPTLLFHGMRLMDFPSKRQQLVFGTMERCNECRHNKSQCGKCVPFKWSIKDVIL